MEAVETELRPDLLQDDVVLRRTAAGQREVLAPQHGLDGTATQLLLLVNGYTPLGALIDTCFPDADLAPSVLQLAELALIEPVPVHTGWVMRMKLPTRR